MQPSPYKSKTGLRRILRAFSYSMSGLKAAYQHEHAFRQELFLAVILIPLTLYLEPGVTGRSLMITSVLLVLVAELLNSAIEAAVDRISLENHELIKRAKDLGSAAVFMALLNMVVTWGLVLFG